MSEGVRGRKKDAGTRGRGDAGRGEEEISDSDLRFEIS
jgi:hypothetical protein